MAINHNKQYAFRGTDVPASMVIGDVNKVIRALADWFGAGQIYDDLVGNLTNFDFEKYKRLWSAKIAELRRKAELHVSDIQNAINSVLNQFNYSSGQSRKLVDDYLKRLYSQLDTATSNYTKTQNLTDQANNTYATQTQASVGPSGSKHASLKSIEDQYNELVSQKTTK